MNTILFKRWGIIAFAAVVAILLAGWFYVTASDADKITVCVKQSGLMFLRGEGFRKTECLKGESTLSWNIQGIPGEKGDAGVDGKNGIDGKDGVKLHLFDANEQDFGVYVGEHTSNPPEQPITFHLDMGLFFRFTQSGTESRRAEFHPKQATLFFEQLDCKGDMYVVISQASGGYHQNVYETNGEQDPRRFPLFTIGKESVLRTIYSESSGDAAFKCKNYTVPQTKETLIATEFILPFTEPLAWPLEVKMK